MVCLIPYSQFWDVPSAQNILFLSKFKFILETHFNPVSPKSHWWGLLPSGPVSPSAEPPSPVHVATLWFILRLSCFLALLPVDLFLSFHSHGKSCLLPFCLCLHPIWADVSGVCDVPAARWCERGGRETHEERGLGTADNQNRAW